MRAVAFAPAAWCLAGGEAKAFADARSSQRETGVRAAPLEPASDAEPGFFAVSAGASVIAVDLRPERGYEDYSADGTSLSLDLLMGVSPRRGAALGAGLFLDFAPSLGLPGAAGKSADSFAGVSVLGPFVDGFPEPDWKLHFGLGIGFAALSLNPSGSSRYPSYGLGGAAWAGSQFLDGRHWSMGLTLRVVRTMAGDEPGEFDFQTTSLAASLQLTAMRR